MPIQFTRINTIELASVRRRDPAAMQVGEPLRLLQTGNWHLVATRGSHRHFKHATKLSRVTVPAQPGGDLAPGTLAQH